MRGQHYERQLAKRLSEAGYMVMRAPSSGSATKRELPDLFWSKPNEKITAAELKAKDGSIAYFNDTEVDALVRFAQAFDADPRLVARFKNDTTFYSCSIEDARITDSNRYAVDRQIDTLDELDP